MSSEDVAAEARPGSAPATRIVVGIDGSEASYAALRWADEQACMSGAELELVHVFTSASQYAFSAGSLPAVVPCEPRAFEESARDLLRKALLLVEPSARAVKLTVVDESPTIRGLQHASAGASMLVLGAHRRHGLGVLLGSTATSCVRNAICPVVVVPGPVAEPVRPRAGRDGALTR